MLLGNKPLNELTLTSPETIDELLKELDYLQLGGINTVAIHDSRLPCTINELDKAGVL